MFVFKTVVPSYVQTTYVEPQGHCRFLLFRCNTRKVLAWSMQLATFIVTSGGFWQLCKLVMQFCFTARLVMELSRLPQLKVCGRKSVCFKFSYDNSCM